MATITSTQSGNYADGSTWVGGVAPVAGTDDFVIAHTVTVPVSTSAEGHGTINTDKELVVNGTLDLDGDLTIASLATLSGTSGTLNLGGFNIGAVTYYSSYFIDLEGTADSKFYVNGSGRMGYCSGTNVFAKPIYRFNHATLDSLTGFNSYGNRGSTNGWMNNSLFKDCTGTIYLLQGVPHTYETGTITIENTVFDNCTPTSSINIGANFPNDWSGTVTPFKLINTVFKNSSQLWFGAGWDLSGVVLHNTILYCHYGASGSTIESLFQFTDNTQSPMYIGGCTYSNCYICNDYSNSHMFGTGNIADGDTFTLKDSILEVPWPTGDGCDLIPISTSSNDTNLFSIHDNIVIDKSGGVFVNALGSAFATDVDVYNNTLHGDSSTYGQLARTEGGGSFTGDSVSFTSNLVHSPVDRATSRGFNMTDSSVADQITNVDFNCWSQIGDPYYQVAITGKTYGDAGFGGSDLSVDPQFKDDTASLATWDASLGGAGTAANAATEMAKLNDSDFDSNYTIDNLLAFVKDGFTPNNMDLLEAGESGTYVGALEPVSAGVSTEQTITASTGDVLNIIVSINAPTVGNLSLRFDGLSLDLTADLDFNHTLLSDNPTLTLTVSDDSDGSFVDVSMEKYLYGYVPNGVISGVNDYVSGTFAALEPCVLNAPDVQAWTDADANLGNFWFTGGVANDIDPADLIDISTQQFIDTDIALLDYGDDIEDDCLEETNKYLGK